MIALLPSIAPLAADSARSRPFDLMSLDAADIRRAALNILAIWILAWLGWEIVKLLARRIVAVATEHPGETPTFREKRGRTIAQLVRGTGRGLIIVAAVLLTLNQFFNITTLLGGAAVIGLAVSFGAQSLVKDYLAGFFILLENQFVVGDSVDAAGKSGIVEKLTLRTVTLRDIEGVVHIIPNGQITTLSNKARGWSRAVVDIGISYDSDIDAAIATLKDESARLAADPDWAWRFEAQPDVLGIESFTDTGVVIRTLLQTRAGMAGDVAREFRRRVVMRFEREGIKGAHHQQVINVHAALAPSGAAPSKPEDISKTTAAGGDATAGQANPPPRAPDPNASIIPGSS